MSNVKKLLWIILTTLFMILGILFILIPLNFEYFIDSYGKYFTQNTLLTIFIVIGIFFIICATILIIDLLIHKDQKNYILIHEDLGDVRITKTSLKNVLKSSANTIPYVTATSSKASIFNGNSIKAIINCDVKSNTDFKTIGANIKKEAIYGIRTLTGIDDVCVDVNLKKVENKKEQSR